MERSSENSGEIIIISREIIIQPVRLGWAPYGDSLLWFGKFGNCLSDELLLLKDDSLSLKESLLSQNGEFVVNKGTFVILTQKY